MRLAGPWGFVILPLLHDQVDRTLDRDVEGVDLLHLLELPHGSLAMPSIARSLMAVLAQGHHGVLAVLLGMMGVTGAGVIADAARQLLDQPDVSPLLSGEGVVHDTALSMARLEASSVLKTSIRA